MTKKKVNSTLVNFTSPESSNVEGGVYDPETSMAVVAFRDKKDPNAKTVFYSYAAVTEQDWDALVAAESKGKHMSKVFKHKYVGTPIVGGRP